MTADNFKAENEAAKLQNGTAPEPPAAGDSVCDGK